MGCDAARFKASFKTVNCQKPNSASFGLVLWHLARQQRAWAVCRVMPRAEGLDRLVVRMSNTYIANGDWKLEEILSELRDGVYLVEKGEKTKLLRDVSLSGKILETLIHVRAVGNDLKFNSGRCGKAGQLLPVSDGSPHLLLAEATVGGAG